jgi:hypothetical protein
LDPIYNWENSASRTGCGRPSAIQANTSAGLPLVERMGEIDGEEDLVTAIVIALHIDDRRDSGFVCSILVLFINRVSNGVWIRAGTDKNTETGLFEKTVPGNNRYNCDDTYRPEG